METSGCFVCSIDKNSVDQGQGQDGGQSPGASYLEGVRVERLSLIHI